MQGLFSTYSGNSFSNFLITTNLDGGVATDGVNTRRVYDPIGAFTVGSGSFNMSASAAIYSSIYYAPQSRTAGKILINQYNFSSGQNASLGWFANTSTGENIFTLRNTTQGRAYSSSTEDYFFSGSTNYQTATILKSAGAYSFIRGGTQFPNWTLVGFESTKNASSVIPEIETAGSAAILTSDYIRIPTSTFLPNPLAYDTFTSAGTTATETTGPDGQSAPSLVWTNTNKSGGTMSVVPSVGSELMTNGNMETGNPPTGYSVTAGTTLSSVADQRTGGTGTQALSVVNGQAVYGFSGQTLAMNLGTWFFLNGYARSVNATAVVQVESAANEFRTSNSSWTNLFFAGRTTTTSPAMGMGNATTPIGNETRYDDMSVKPLVLSSLFSTVGTTTADVIMDVGISLTTGTQAGLVLGLDNNTSPSNFILVYHNGTKLYVDEAVNGVYTNKQNTSVALGAGQLRAVKDGTKLRVYLNNALVGAELTMTANTNTRHGIFSTYAGNTFDNFSIFARGTGGEYSGMPAEDLTVSYDTGTKYAGSGSAKLIAAGNDANFIQSVTVGTTDVYNLSGYVYSTGATVTSNDVQLYYGSSAIGTSFSSVGSGWYRMMATVVGTTSPQNYGVRVKAGKTVYVDSMSLAMTQNSSTGLSLDAGQKIFNGGYAVTSDQWGGIYKDIGVTAGQDVVIRGFANSDGVSQAQLILYDQSNGNEIGSVYGTTTSTRTAPDVLLFTGEAPAGCTTIRVKAVNASPTNSTVYWHQVEVYNNLINKPSYESGSGDPWIPSGWTNFQGALIAGNVSQETSIVHSGGSSLRWSTTSSGKSVMQNYSSISGKFYTWGLWSYGDGTAGLSLGDGNSILKDQASNSNVSNNATPVSTGWKLSSLVGRANSNGTYELRVISGNGSVGYRYSDDMYFMLLDDVSLTATPASLANSTESTGIRVDGADTLTQSVTGLSTTNGTIKFKFTPRHSFADADKYGNSAPRVFEFGSGNDRLLLYKETATNMQLYGVFNGVTKTANVTSPILNAGQTYNIQVSYNSGGMFGWYIDGVLQVGVTMSGAAFGTVPTTIYFGSTVSGATQYDATFSNFATSAVTQNTTAPYVKFGSNSVKIDNSTGSLPDEYTATMNVGVSGTAYTLSAYVYDGTTGNVGGDVGSSQAQLFYANVGQTTAYADQGGGWWRLTSTVTGLGQTVPAGIQVKGGKIIYLDGVQMEQKAYATTYADGSLGTGYSWAGTANNSNSTRAKSNITYAPTYISNSNGTISIWFKPNFNLSVNAGTGQGYNIISGLSDGWMNDLLISVYGDRLYFYYGTTSFSYAGSTSWLANSWHHLVLKWDSNKNVTGYVDGNYVNSATSAVVLASPSRISLGSGSYNNGATVSDLRIYDQPLTANEVGSLYNEGLMTHQTGNEGVARYVGAGTYTSPVIDLGANGNWGVSPINWTQNLMGGSLAYYTRTSSDNAIWSDWVSQIGSSITSDPRRYMQFKADLTANSDRSQSPSLGGMVVSYVEDSNAPSNPLPTDVTVMSDGTTSAVPLTTQTWYNYVSPYFSWNAGIDTTLPGQSASGISKYYVEVTKDIGATPASDAASACYGEKTDSDRTFSCSLTSSGTYYFITQTKDNSGNISAPQILFTYYFDKDSPQPPASVSTTTIGFSANNDFTFYWPTATDVGSAGVVGYEYKTGDVGSSWTYITETTVSGIAAYTEGQNIFYVRAVDRAGNRSVATTNQGTAAYYYNESAPTAVQNITITPETDDGRTHGSAPTNKFTVSWDKPATYAGEIAKYYYCVNCTPAEGKMTETTGDETVLRKLTNAALATQQGKNTIYIVAEDNNINAETGKGNVNYSAYSSADFYAATLAPAAPTNLLITDASDRDGNKWRLTLAWDHISVGSTDTSIAAVDHFDLYRSTDNISFVKVGTVTGTAYTDGSLSQSKTYYYKVKAVDDAGSESSFSNTVYKAAEGKYTTPPSAGGTPGATTGATTAMIRWATSRTAYGTVEFGETSDYGSAASDTISTKDHAVKLTGLAPGKTYHYRVLSMDDSDLVGYDRSAAYSGDYTFTTLATAEISDVKIEEVSLNSATITWKTRTMATSQIAYGTTTEYGTVVEVATTDGENVQTAHLTDLKFSATYHFMVSGKTADGDNIASQDMTFDTITFPEVTAYVLKTDQNSGGTTISVAYATNVETTTEVEYQRAEIVTADGVNPNFEELSKQTQQQLAQVKVNLAGDPVNLAVAQLATTHIIKADALQDGSMYIFRLKGRDKYGNVAISEPIRYVTGKDTRPPVISNVTVESQLSGSGSSSTAQVVVSWDTDEPATTQVIYGPGTGTEYPLSTPEETGLTKQHVVVIRDLQPTNSYHLQIVSNDESKNKAESADLIVVTPAVAESALDVVLKNLEDVFGFLNL